MTVEGADICVVRVLGPVGVDRDGDIAPVPGQQGEVLSLLVAALPSVVRIDTIIEALWGDNPTKSARTGLGVVIHRLRERLTGCAEIVNVHGGYRLDIEPTQLDVSIFDQLLAEAKDADAAQDHAEAATLLTAALAQWRGNAFQPFESSESLHVVGTALEERRRDAEDLLLDSLLASGRPDEAATWASDLVETAPYRERRWHRLALALYRCGRQTEALRALTRAARTLRDDIGVEPGTELRQLEHDILDQADHLDAPAHIAVDAVMVPTAAHPARSTSRVGDPETSFVGRDRESLRLDELLAAHRFVSVIGSAGTGKTRLAARHVRSVPDHRVVWVDLVPLNADDILPALASAVGTSAAIDHQLDGVVRVLRTEPTIVVFDNCEHVVDAVAALTDDLLARDGTTRFLTTSRTPLGSAHETKLHLPALDLDDGVRLLIERAYGGVLPTTTSRDEIESLVDQLGAIPLLIELVAEPVRSTSAADVSMQLASVMSASTSPGSDPRHESLATAIGWSVDLLDADQQQLNAALSVMAAGFVAADVAAVVERDVEAVRDGLSGLCAHGLVTVDGASDPPRYRQPLTVAIHAAQQLSEIGDRDRLRLRHAGSYTHVVRNVAPTLWTADEPLAVDRLASIRDQLEVAFATLVERSDTEQAAELAVLMWDYSFLRLDIAQFGWFDDLVAMPGLAELDNHADVLGSAAMAAWARNDFAESIRLADMAMNAAGDGTPPLQALRARFNVASFQAPDTDAMEAFGGLINATIEHGPPHLRSDLQVLLTLGLSQVGETSGAADAARRGMDIAEKTSNPSCLAWATYGDGWSLLDRDPVDASRSFLAAARMARTVRNQFVESMAKGALVTSALRRGRTTQARSLLVDVIAMWSRLESTPQLIRACREAVMVLAGEGEHDRARIALAHVELLDAGHPLAPPDQRRFDELAGELGEPDEPVGFDPTDTLAQSIIELLRD